MDEGPVHRIDDFRRPGLPALVRTANWVGRPFAGAIRLEPEALLEAACRKARLDDFGDDAFR